MRKKGKGGKRKRERLGDNELHFYEDVIAMANRIERYAQTAQSNILYGNGEAQSLELLRDIEDAGHKIRMKTIARMKKAKGEVK